MPDIVYRCDITLHDYLFFATTERGKIAETGPFVHNYALTYAMGWVARQWYNHTQKPRYLADLAPITDRYITPAQLVHGISVVMQYNTLSERLRVQKQQSIGYPDWGFIKCFKPETLFRAYVFAHEQLSFPMYIRLGKFMAKAHLHVTVAQQVKQDESDHKVMHLLNWSDLHTKPVVFNVQAASLPSRLISHAYFEACPFLHARFSAGEDIWFPSDMGYLQGADIL